MILLKTNPIDIMLLLIFLYPLLKGFFVKYSSDNLKNEVEDVNKDIIFLISLFFGIYSGKKIFFQHDEDIYKKIYMYISLQIRNFIEDHPIVVYIILIPLLCFIIYKILMWIINIINSITIYPLFDAIERHLRDKKEILKRLTGLIVEIPKSFCYIIAAVFILNMVSIFNIADIVNPYLQYSEAYRYICKQVIIPVTKSKLAKKLPDILNNSFKIAVKETENQENGNSIENKVNVVYYNGVTLDEGVKSNNEIDSFAKKLCAGKSTPEKKAKTIYFWIGQNISYDDDKALSVVRNDFDVKSGAISTFRTRKGICFDYACLYVAMCRADKIKVRLVTGEGFNGVSWVSHAWNQVYIPEKNEWINVDTTFYKGGDYFNSKRFNIDHKNAKVVGEWQV